MVHLLTVGNWLLPLLYLALLIDYGATFFLRTRTHARSPWLWAVAGVHAALLVLRGVYYGYVPAHAQEVLSGVALAMATVYAVVESASRDRRTGVFVMLLAFLLQYTSSILLAAGAPAPQDDAAESSWGRLHVVPAMVAYTALGFACVYGLLHLAARRGLKHHRFGVLFDRLPPLDLLGRMTWHALVAGFIFMTLTIATGPAVAASGGAAAGDLACSTKVLMKIVSGGVAWLIYAAAMAGRLAAGWSSQRIAVVAVAGYAVVAALLVASALLS